LFIVSNFSLLENQKNKSINKKGLSALEH